MDYSLIPGMRIRVSVVFCHLSSHVSECVDKLLAAIDLINQIALITEGTDLHSVDCQTCLKKVLLIEDNPERRDCILSTRPEEEDEIDAFFMGVDDSRV